MTVVPAEPDANRIEAFRSRYERLSPGAQEFLAKVAQVTYAPDDPEMYTDLIAAIRERDLIGTKWAAHPGQTSRDSLEALTFLTELGLPEHRFRSVDVPTRFGTERVPLAAVFAAVSQELFRQVAGAKGVVVQLLQQPLEPFDRASLEAKLTDAYVAIGLDKADGIWAGAERAARFQIAKRLAERLLVDPLYFDAEINDITGLQAPTKHLTGVRLTQVARDMIEREQQVARALQNGDPIDFATVATVNAHRQVVIEASLSQVSREKLRPSEDVASVLGNEPRSAETAERWRCAIEVWKNAEGTIDAESGPSAALTAFRDRLAAFAENGFSVEPVVLTPGL